MSLLQSPRRKKPGFRLALLGCVLAVVVVGLGAFTRLVDAGLGCPDWPGCYGHVLWPIAPENIERANAAWPDTPVDHSKTWPEMVHRYFATLLGVITIGLVWIAVRNRHRPAQPIKLPLFLLAFIILQGLFGMWTVTLKLWPQVVTAHLLGGFTTFALLWLLANRLGNWRWRFADRELLRVASLKPWAVVGLIVVALQIFLGGWTTSNYADVACPDFPTCQGQWWPAMDFSHGFNIFQSVGPNYLGGMLDNEGRMAIHYTHRLGALVTAAYLLFLAVKMWRTQIGEVRRMAIAIVAILIVQVLLGIGNVVLQFPISVAVAHNLGGAVLLLALVTLIHRVRTAQPR